MAPEIVYDLGLADPLLIVAQQITTWDTDGRWSSHVHDIPEVRHAIDALHARFGVRYPIVAFQAYRDGSAVTPWHDDRTMADETIIVSAGATRRFQIRTKDTCDEFQLVALHDSGIILPAEFHHLFEHRIGPEPDVTTPRYSFVFRTNPQPMKVS